ncbi:MULTISPECIES: hypothetical protein [unclassified Streptomyces]|uniref:hypothetical protein n=1 Tax=unclassified Streptomyces TaxID=2593676 RepID=UPI00278BF54D|nr:MULTISPECIES: hypothetical protein [unclassified Streptomyces]
MLPVDSVLDLVGKSRMHLLGLGFHVSSGQFDVSDEVTEPPGLATRCTVDGVEISVETTAGAHNPYGVYTFQSDEESFPVPLNASWQGFMVTKNDQATASVLLNCKNWAAKEGSGILVAAEPPSEAKATEAVRLKLARVVTGTAERAAERTGCVTDKGDAGKLAAPAATAKTVSADDATGTCKGMSSARTVRETAAGVSPVEECLLVGGMQLTAEYHPFSDTSDASDAVAGGRYGGHSAPSGADRDSVWTTATCHGALGIGYYHAAPVEGRGGSFTVDPLNESERKDLERFAEESAARHACGSPKALPR